jgi:predicted Zn-dependent protease
MACILLALLTQSRAPAQVAEPDVPSTPSSAESSKKNPVAKEDANKVNKYDVDRIGQRDISRGWNVYSARREYELGQKLAAGVERNTKFINDPIINDYVNRLGQKLVRNSDAKVPFTIRVIDSGDNPRAYSLPGGFLYVDKALILATDGEAELASVMAHEIAHVAARHATRALTRKHLCSLVDSVAFLTGPTGMILEDVGGVAGPLSVKKFNRDAEYEADLLGIEYAYAAGYDPQALLVALEKLHALEVMRAALFAKIPGYHLATRLPFHRRLANSFSNYPLTEERMHRLQSEIPTFLPDRKDYIVDTNEFQEVKARLLASEGPTLRRHAPGEDDTKGPVLRRNRQYENEQYESDIRTLPGLANTPGDGNFGYIHH